VPRGWEEVSYGDSEISVPKSRLESYVVWS